MLQIDFPEYDSSIAQEFGMHAVEANNFLGIPFFEIDSLLQLVIRFTFNIVITWIIIRYFYYRKHGRRDFLFTFTLFAVTVFLLIYLLDTVKLQVGMALGLFAIFGIIRYRTEQVSIREMTYLFVIIGISVINGLAMAISIFELIAANLLFVSAVAILESSRFIKDISTKAIRYDKIELVVADKRDELIADLEERTGLKIIRVEVGHIDFLRDIALLNVQYKSEDKYPNSIDKITSLKKI